jgi:glycerol kinase
VVETTAQGAAFMAGLACGLWKAASEIERVRVVDRRFEPAASVSDRVRARDEWKLAVECSRRWHPAEGPRA